MVSATRALRSSCPGSPLPLWVQSRGTWGKDAAGGVHCVGSGGDAAGGLGAVFGKDAVEERGTDLLWGWLLLDWWWNGWGDGW